MATRLVKHNHLIPSQSFFNPTGSWLAAYTLAHDESSNLSIAFTISPS